MKIHTYTVRCLFEVALKDAASTPAQEAALASELSAAIQAAVNAWRGMKNGNAMAGQVTAEVRSSGS